MFTHLQDSLTAQLARPPLQWLDYDPGFFSHMECFLNLFAGKPANSKAILRAQNRLLLHTTSCQYNIPPISDLVCMADYIHNSHHNPSVTVGALHNLSSQICPQLSDRGHNFIGQILRVFKGADIPVKWSSQALEFSCGASRIPPDAQRNLKRAIAHAKTSYTQELVQHCHQPHFPLFSKQAQFWHFALGAQPLPPYFYQEEVSSNLTYITPSIAGCSFFYNSNCNVFDEIRQANLPYGQFPTVPLYIQTKTLTKGSNHYVAVLYILLDILRLDFEDDLTHTQNTCLAIAQALDHPNFFYHTAASVVAKLPKKDHVILDSLNWAPSGIRINVPNHTTLSVAIPTFVSTLGSHLPCWQIKKALFSFQNTWQTAEMPPVSFDDVLIQASWLNYKANQTDMFPADSRAIHVIEKALKNAK